MAAAAVPTEESGEGATAASKLQKGMLVRDKTIGVNAHLLLHLGVRHIANGVFDSEDEEGFHTKQEQEEQEEEQEEQEEGHGVEEGDRSVGADGLTLRRAILLHDIGVTGGLRDAVSQQL
jgi:hypothetical protein